MAITKNVKMAIGGLIVLIGGYFAWKLYKKGSTSATTPDTTTPEVDKPSTVTPYKPIDMKQATGLDAIGSKFI